ncbi:MAG: hypothetical protein M3329_01025 [Pseudomonadota bacterium]|nr:hypothetical protein [Pseudomonadota bacterium]
MLHAKRCIQWCIVGLLPLSLDLFSASGFISSDGVFGCSSGDAFLDGGERTFSFNLTEGTQGWRGGFAEYPLGQEVFYELIFDYRPLLPDLDPNETAFSSPATITAMICSCSSSTRLTDLCRTKPI